MGRMARNRQSVNRRAWLKSAAAGLTSLALPARLWGSQGRSDRILVVVELSGGNDGLNTVVPIHDPAYYRARPNLGLAAADTLAMDDDYGLNPGALGLQRLWQRGQLAVVHGCGYAQPSYSHFTSMAYWHTGAPHGGSAYGWLGRVADAMAQQRQDNLLVNIAAHQSLAVKSRYHTPVVFDDPARFQRNRWMNSREIRPVTGATEGNRQFLASVDRSAQLSAAQIRAAWQRYQTDVDYGIAGLDLPKVAACIQAGLGTPIYHVAFRNNAFDTHVQQPALHQRLLSYASDAIHGFVRDLERLGVADRVVVLVHSEFGRRVAENANLGTDHGSANLMLLAGAPVQGGHYGARPSLTDLVDGGNLQFTTDFRRVYATVIENWLGVPAAAVLEPGLTPLTGIV